MAIKKKGDTPVAEDKVEEKAVDNSAELKAAEDRAAEAEKKAAEADKKVAEADKKVAEAEKKAAEAEERAAAAESASSEETVSEEAPELSKYVEVKSVAKGALTDHVDGSPVTIVPDVPKKVVRTSFVQSQIEAGIFIELKALDELA